MKGLVMKQLVLCMVLWQSCFISGADLSFPPIDFKSIFQTAINNKDKDTAIGIFAQLQLLISADSKYFNVGQAGYLFELKTRFTHQIVTTFGVSDVDVCMLEARKQEISSLITRIEKNELQDDLYDILGVFIVKPSKNELLWHRIEFLKKLKEYYDYEG
jgi:hypothetical protein